jgi:UDP-N-acetylglucosamine--N-acetylmuramyl-(pentapeptide) pyrophosphoryl-undecaprenol N-acetylglucosamine transferase
MIYNDKLLSKLAYDDLILENLGAGAQNLSVLNVRDNSSTKLTMPLPSGVEFRKKSMKTIIVTGGGTGGHLFPAIALGEELMRKGYKVHLITDNRCQKYLTEDLTIISHLINFKLPANKGILSKIKLLMAILLAVYQSIILLVKIKPHAIIGFGGYPTFPPMLAAVLLNIPIIIYEQNCFIGKSNRFFLRFASKIALTYPETKNINIIDSKKILVVGSIVRTNVKNLKVKDHFNNEIFRIFIFGGSQGARILSSLLPEAIRILVVSYPEVKLHITQQASLEEQVNIAEIYDKLKITYKITYKLAEFFHDMDQQYENHELVISRAGASTIAELSYVGLPAIFIPLPSSSENHQFYNAKALDDQGAGWCFEQNKISPKILADKILVLIKSRDILQKASSKLLTRKSDGSLILLSAVEKIIN